MELKPIILPFAAEIVDTNIWLEIGDDLSIKYHLPFTPDAVNLDMPKNIQFFNPIGNERHEE
jgi:hypothetical protein